jgi:4-hydroxy-3-polyprenylbenzoate decarboxylase
MGYRDLRHFIDLLESKGELVRISEQVDTDLEITEITDRVSKAVGPALLFENVKGSDMPVLINMFGSFERTKLAFEIEELDDIGQEIMRFLDMPTGSTSLFGKLKQLPKLAELGSFFPKTVTKAPCQEVVLTGDQVDLNKFPVLKCWPDDGGKFITLPLVFTKDPISGKRNCGMYRMQVYDKNTTGMHWQLHKVGAEHHRRSQEMNMDKLEVAVAIGSDPAVIYSAIAPVPPEIDEMILAGFLRKEAVEMVKCKTVDLEVPANAEIILEGYVIPGELRDEGPFGDHNGYYTPVEPYPVFHVTAVTHRKNPIYSTTIVGKPPMEDCYLGKLTERIFLFPLKMVVPEIVDMSLPWEGVFHNCAIVSIKKRYPGHAKKVMSALWGMGQMAWTKSIIVVDDDVDVHDHSYVAWRVFGNVDAKRDLMIVEGPVDSLDHASPLPNLGSKIGIDGTRKWKEEGYNRVWPDEIWMDDETAELVNRKWDRYGIKL